MNKMSKESAIKVLEMELKCVNTDCGIEQKACIGCKLAMPSRDPIVAGYKIAIEALKESIKK